MAASDGWEENWKLAFPTEFLAAEHLHGREVAFTISRVVFEEMEMARTSASGKVTREKRKRLVIYLAELANRGPDEPKKILLNKTNCAALEAMHGKAPRLWKGKRFSVRGEIVEAWGKKKEALRIQPNEPPPPRSDRQAAPPSSEITDEERQEILDREREEQGR